MKRNKHKQRKRMKMPKPEWLVQLARQTLREHQKEILASRPKIGLSTEARDLVHNF